MKLQRSFLAVSVAMTAMYGSSALGLDITIENNPVNYGNRARPNILLAIDDSSSMDVEMGIKGTVEGFGYWNNGYFVDDAMPEDFSGVRYTHLFPLGDGSSGQSSSSNIYNGGRKWGENYMPPFDAYGFFRSSDWNGAYYDPSVTYDPWPSYGGHSWPNIQKDKAWLDAGLVNSTSSDRYLDLTQTTLATRFSGGNTSFDFKTGMWCDNSGSKCSSNTSKALDYWAATYYVKDDTSSFTRTSGSGAPETYVSPTDALVIEAESGTLSDVSIANSTAAAKGAYLDFDDPTSYIDNPPSTHEAAWTFSTTATSADIWVRRYMPDTNTDSFWVSMDDHPSTSVTPDDSNNWVTQGGQDWYQWRDGHETPGLSTNFVWEKWGTVALDNSGTYTLRIRQRESYVGLDQIAVVIGDEPSFATVAALTNDSGTTYSCGNEAHLLPQNYTNFHDYPGSFTGVDAFAPDGSCLERVEIRSSRADYPSGRTYEQEIQNFANWFTYYRKRHQTTRGALGSALQGISSVRAGLFWINNRRTINMFDLDVPADLTTLLDENYYYVSSGSTPNRNALNHAGSQLDSNANIIQYACQKNYTLLFTDGYGNDDSFSSVGNADSGEGEPYADNVSNTVADVAHHYYETKLRSGDFDAGKVPVHEDCAGPSPDPWLDCNTELHMNTYAVSMGLTGEEVFEQPYSDGSISGFYEKVRDAYKVAPTWPTSLGFDGRMMDDLYHAAVNGRGEMFSAQASADLAGELQDAIRAILATEGSASGLSFNTATLSTESLLFSASFNTTNWSGELKATNLDPSTGDPTTVAWSAQSKLDNQSSRTIITYDAANRTGIPFQWNDLTATQKADLSVGPDGNADLHGEKRIDYLRGDRSLEGNLFRERSSALGDIVNSSPVYVGPAVMGWPEYEDNNKFGSSTHSYSRFKVEQGESRMPMVYVAANDGMVHGFRADRSTSAGEEKLAFIPSAMYSTNTTRGLHYLTDPDYAHRFYTDGEPVYSDVFIKAKGETTRDWMTILAGGYQGGAKGLYALDVTDPTTFTEANAAQRVLFEYTADVDDDLGYLHEPPMIGMMNNGEWAMIFGNGFNSVNGNGVVYIAFIEDIIQNGWIENTNFYKYDTGVNGAIGGVSATDTDGDKVIDYLYATDAAGLLWSLDVTSTNDSQWGFAYGTTANPLPLFTAEDEFGNRQPILVRPRVIRNISVDTKNNNEPNRLVVFGTGQMLQESDLSNTNEQSFYAVWDDGTGNLDRTDLAESALTQAANGDRQATNGTSLYQGSNKGFYVDFDIEAGERIIDYMDIRRHKNGDYYALFSSVLPESDPCSYGGRSWINAFDLASGATTEQAVFDTNGDGVVDGNDSPVAGISNDHFLVDFVSSGQNGYGNSSEGKIVTTTLESGVQLTNGRLGWQELINR